MIVELTDASSLKAFIYSAPYSNGSIELEKIWKLFLLLCIVHVYVWEMPSNSICQIRKKFLFPSFNSSFVQSVKSRHQYFRFFLKKVVNIAILELAPISNESPSPGNSKKYHISLVSDINVVQSVKSRHQYFRFFRKKLSISRF